MHTLLHWQQRLVRWGGAPFLALAAAGWGGVLALRRKAYGLGALKSWTPPVPCVSVGNIASGGGGKTPLALWLLHWAQERNLRACLLTRGYGAKPPRLPFFVDPAAVRDWREAGDEPLLLAREAPAAAVVVDPDRVRGAKQAVSRARPEIFVMDDGMQHLRMGRHLNLVLLRLEDFDTGWGRVIPHGQWREPESALRSADAFLVKATPEEFTDAEKSMLRRVGRFERPLFQFHLEPEGLRRVADGATLADAEERSYLFFSALAGNEQAAATAEAFMGRPAEGRMFFADHHGFDAADLARIEAERSRLGAELVVCTGKDAVKLAGLVTPAIAERLYSLKVAARFSQRLLCDTNFPQWWEGWWEGHRLQRGNCRD